MRSKYLRTACALVMTVGATMATNGVAQATTIQETIVGSISSGIDTDGLFSSPGTDLTGAHATLSFMYDTASCPSTTCAYNHFGSQEELYYLNTESISVSINSNQQSYSSSNNFAGVNLAATSGQGFAPTLINLWAYNATGGSVQTYLYSSHVWTPGDIYSQAAVDALVNNLIPGSIGFLDGTTRTREFFQFAPLQSTPLPATLPLFASGLGALGLLGWRRKRKAQAAA